MMAATFFRKSSNSKLFPDSFCDCQQGGGDSGDVFPVQAADTKNSI